MSASHWLVLALIGCALSLLGVFVVMYAMGDELKELQPKLFGRLFFAMLAVGTVLYILGFSAGIKYYG